MRSLRLLPSLASFRLSLAIVATVCAAFVLPGQPTQAATIGIVAVEPQAKAVGDALTVALSQITNVVLLERAEIDRVLREKQLSLQQPRSALEVGKLLGARGVLLLEQHAGEQTNQALSVRIVATAPGVVLVHDEFPLPLTPITSWASSYAARVERILPKLNVKPEDAVPVSLGSLRFSVPVAEGTTLEKELTMLLRLRLAREPDAFVLERREMETLQREKDFGAVEEPFWNGAYVIDGVINRDVVSPTNLTIDVRVAAPRVAPVEFRVQGRRESAVALVDSLVTNLLATIGKKRSAPAWQTEAEAEKFLQEAQWAAAWQLWPQAREAADASWFLGNHTQLAAAYRIVARGSLALLAGDREPNGSAIYDKYGFLKTPSPEGLTLMAQTLELFPECVETFSREGRTNQIDAAWNAFGMHLLPLTSRVLEPYHQNVSYRSGQEKNLSRLRFLARALNEWLMTNNVTVEEERAQKRAQNLSAAERLAAIKRETFAPRPKVSPPLPRVYYIHYRHDPNSLAAAWFESGGLWFESPEQAVNMYERLLNIPGYYAARNLFPGNGSPPLSCWNPNDRQSIDHAWSEFMNKMAASTNLLMSADGNALILSFSTDPVEIEKAAQVLSKIAIENRTLTAEAAKASRIAMMEWPAAISISNAWQRLQRWGVPQAETVRRAAQFTGEQITKLEAAASYRDWTNLLHGFTGTNSRPARMTIPIARLNAAQVAELILGFERAERQLSASDRSGKSVVASALATLRSQQRLIERAETKPKIREVTSEPPRRQDPALPTPISAKPLSESAPRIMVSRVWRAGEQTLPGGREFPWRSQLSEMFWKDGSLWVTAKTWDSSARTSHEKPVFLKFDPVTLRPEVIEIPSDEYIAPGVRTTQIANGEIYFAGKEFLWHRDSKGSWSKIPVPVTGVPLIWGNSVVLSGADAVVRVMLDSQEVRILASHRRNPAVTPLDSLSLWDAAFTVWPDNKLYALIGKQQVWRFDEQQNNWQLLLSATNCGETLQLEPQGIFFRQSGQCGDTQLFGGWRPGLSAALVFVDSTGCKRQVHRSVHAAAVEDA